MEAPQPSPVNNTGLIGWLLSSAGRQDDKHSG